MSKRIAAIVLAVTFLSLAVAPETLAQRSRRDCNRSVNTRSYNSYQSRGVAGQRYYAEPNYRGRADSNYYGQPYNRDYRGYRGGGHSTRDAILTVGAPAAVGAGVGAILDGTKGAGIGALLGGGGGALFYLLKNRGRRR